MDQLHDWFTRVPDSTQMVFEQIWVDAPQVLLHALNADAAVGDIDTGQTFAEWVGAAVEGASSIKVATPGVEDLLATPERPNPGAAFTVSWTALNYGQRDLPARTDTVVLYDASSQVIDQVSVVGAGIPAGGRIAQQATVTAPDQAQGVLVVVWVNPEGADLGQPTGPAGFRGSGSLSFEVGDVPVADLGAEDAVGQAANSFTAVGMARSADELIYSLGQGLTLLERLAASFVDPQARQNFLSTIGACTGLVANWQAGLTDEQVKSVAEPLRELPAIVESLAGSRALSDRLAAFGESAANQILDSIRLADERSRS